MTTGASRTIAGVVLFPGAGSSASHASLVSLEEVLSPLPVARIDFPYRRAGRRAPDRANVLMDCVRDEVVRAAKRWKVPMSSVVIGGRSMGGRMCSMAVADAENTLEVAGLVCVCYPLHPPKQPEKLRSEHLPRILMPTLFVSGRRDEFGTVEELTAATKPMNKKTHVWIEGARHDLKNRDAEVGEIIANWIIAQ